MQILKIPDVKFLGDRRRRREDFSLHALLIMNIELLIRCERVFLAVTFVVAGVREGNEGQSEITEWGRDTEGERLNEMDEKKIPPLLGTFYAPSLFVHTRTFKVHSSIPNEMFCFDCFYSLLISTR